MMKNSTLQTPSYFTSAIVLLLVNLIPLLGVIFMSWSISGLIVVYWVELLVVGFFNIVRMTKCEVSQPHSAEAKKIISHVANSKYLENANIKFTGKTTKETLGNKLFVRVDMNDHAAVKKYMSDNMKVIPLFGAKYIVGLAIVWQILYATGIVHEIIYDIGFWFSVTGLFFSHWVSYRINYIGNKEYKKISVQKLFLQPYKRMGFMLILLGVVLFFDQFSLNSITLMLLFVALKIGFDMRSHIHEHRKIDNFPTHDSI